MTIFVIFHAWKNICERTVENSLNPDERSSFFFFFFRKFTRLIRWIMEMKNERNEWEKVYTSMIDMRVDVSSWFSISFYSVINCNACSHNVCQERQFYRVAYCSVTVLRTSCNILSVVLNRMRSRLLISIFSNY